MTMFGSWHGLSAPDSYSVLVASCFSLTTVLDFVWLAFHVSRSVRIVQYSLIFFSILLLLWILSLRFGPPGVLNYIMHLWFGYSVCCALYFASISVVVNQALLPVCTTILRLIVLLLWLFYEGISHSPLDPHHRLEFTMWLGFIGGCFFYANVWQPIHFNCLLLTYWFVLRQRSFLCILALAFQSVVWLFFTVPKWPYSLQGNDVLYEFEPPDISNRFYYFSTCVPLLVVYIFYFLRFNLFPGLFFCRDLATRWSSMILCSHYFRAFLLLLVPLIQLSFVVCCAISIRLKGFSLLWIPLLILAYSFWFVSHCAVYVSLRQLNKKVTQCSAAHQSLGQRNSDFLRIGAAHGIRHLALVSESFHLFALVLTILLMIAVAHPQGLVAYRLFELCLPIELCLYSLFRELGRTLGGTAAGHGVIMQPLSGDLLRDEHGVLTPQSEQLVAAFSQRCFAITQLLQRFFHEFSVHDYGCVYSSCVNMNQNSLVPSESDEQALTVISGRSKLLHSLDAFFRQQLPETGVRFDTYILYHSGPTNQDGDWICEDGTIIDLQSLLELWEQIFEESNTTPQRCRLLLVVDSLNAFSWHQKLSAMETPLSVALQTFVISRDTESTGFFAWITSNLFQSEASRRISLLNDVGQLGKFTDFWVSWNLNLRKVHSKATSASSRPILRRPAASAKPPLRAIYVTTGNWNNYAPCKPSFREMENCWKNNFPRVFWNYFRIINGDSADEDALHTATGCTQFINFLSRTTTTISTWLSRLYRQLFYARLNPAELDTGLGFHLIRKTF